MFIDVKTKYVLGVLVSCCSNETTYVSTYSRAVQYDLASRPQAVFAEVLLNIMLTTPFTRQLHLLNKLEGKFAILYDLLTA